MATTAVLLTNLGSPDSTEVKDLRTYLNEFLMDKRVIDIPYPIRAVLVQGIIVPFRAPKSAEKYKSVWTENGSPLIHTSIQQQKLLKSKISMPVELSMRYGNPTAEAALDKLVRENPDLREVVLVPLYPHYAMSSYETAVEQIKELYLKRKYGFTLSIVPPFYNHPQYIDALSASIAPYLQKSYDHLLFSYHGIPERHVRKSDTTKSHCLTSGDCCDVASKAHATCYRHQVLTTTKLIAQTLNLESGKYSSSFQSRLGADAWLKPNSADLFMQFPKMGIKKLVVACPAFVSDCLETLEEIHMEGRKSFLDNGGEEFTVVPCLNERPDWIETLMTLVQSTIKSAAVPA